MVRPAFSDILDLLKNIVFPFHELKRDMDLPLKNRKKETDTEHSWAVALIACALAERIDKSLDIGKVAQLAIVHDLVEIYAGDTSIWDKEGLKNKEDREIQAIGKLKENTKAFPWIAQTIEEYEKKQSKESLFVWAADKYIATSVRYLDLESGGDFFKAEVPKTLSEFKLGIEPTRTKAHAHPGIGEIYEEALAELTSHPEWFKTAE